MLLLGLTAATVGVLSACTDEAPSPTTTVPGGLSPAVTESAAAEVKKPRRPAAMGRDDAKGAAAAAEYFIELYPYVMATGDTEEWMLLAHESCEFCKELRDQAHTISANGETFEGGETTVKFATQYNQDALTGIYPMDAVVTQQPQIITAADGSIVLDAPKEVVNRRIEVGFEGGQWVMVNVAPIPEQG